MECTRRRIQQSVSSARDTRGGMQADFGVKDDSTEYILRVPLSIL